MRLFLLLLVLVQLAASAKKSGSTVLVQGLSDPKDLKKLLKTKTSVLVAFVKNTKETSTLFKILDEAADAVRGSATVAVIDCSGDAKKICKGQKAKPEPSILKYYKDGEFKKEYDRKMTVPSMTAFLLDPLGDAPWEEDDNAKDVVHIADPAGFSKLLKAEKKPMLIMFYAPWCGFCKRMKPDYSQAATELKGEAVIAAMDVNKPANDKIRYMFNITGFPTLMYFKFGEVPKNYEGENTKDGIVSFMRNPDMPIEKPKDEEEWSDVPSDVVHLTESTFDEYLKAHPSVLVMFYAPWCGHCKKMKPDYQSAAAKLKEQKIEGTLAAVDATKHNALGQRFAVKGYPTVKYFKNGEFMFDVSLRNEAKIMEFMEDPQAPPPPPPPEKAWSDEPSEVVHLDEETFKPFLKRKKHALVMFYAPWCGHCKRAKPEYAAAADKFKEDPRVAFAAVDCTQHNPVCAMYDVKGFPTMKYFSYFKTTRDYEGGRTEKDFVAFMEDPENPSAGKEPPPPPPEVEWAGLEGTEELNHLTDANFDGFVKSKNVLVMFYAPWCGHCKRMKPAYALAAKELKSKSIPAYLAAVDATIQKSATQKAEVQGFPTIKFYRADGAVVEYQGDRSAEDIVSFIRKQVKDEL